MGTNCNNQPYPTAPNQCCVSKGDAMPERMEYFCTLEGSGGNSYRNDFCQKMSNAGEWGKAQQSGSCAYNDCNNVQDFGAGCCNGCCGIAGAGLKCTRLSFTGDPAQCCFNNFNCVAGSTASTCEFNLEVSSNACFSDGGKQNTCSDGKNGTPNYRYIASPDCKDALYQYCTGTLPTDDPNSTDWISRWTTGGNRSCSYAIQKNLVATPDNACAEPFPIVTGQCNIPLPENISADGYFWAQDVMNGVFKHYAENGFVIGTLPGFPGYNPFQDFLYSDVCCPYPGICQNGLATICSNFSSQRLSLNPAVSQWCGCHLSPLEYADYSTKYNIPPQCTPMCNRVGTIPIVGINGEPVNCQQDICLIDGITVNLINSQIGGGIDFNQICGGCGIGQCSCIVEGTTVDVLNSTIGGNFVPINEGCGNFTCTQTNPGPTGPVTINVPCGTGASNPYDEYQAQVTVAKQEAHKTSMMWTLLIIGGSLFIIFLIILLLHPKYRNPGTRTTVTPSKPAPRAEFIQQTPGRFISESAGTISDNTSFISEPTGTNPSFMALPARDYVSILDM